MVICDRDLEEILAQTQTTTGEITGLPNALDKSSETEASVAPEISLYCPSKDN